MQTLFWTFKHSKPWEFLLYFFQHFLSLNPPRNDLKISLSLFTFLRASIFCWSLRLIRIHLLRRLVWYIFSAGTQDLGRRSGGMVMPYSQPAHNTHNEFLFQLLLLNSCISSCGFSEHLDRPRPCWDLRSTPPPPTPSPEDTPPRPSAPLSPRSDGNNRF